MLSIILSSESLRWAISECAVLILASIGGVVVLIGIRMEHHSVKKWFTSVEDGHRQEKRGETGYLLVMWGIGIETFIAAALALQDGLEIRQIQIDAARNNPLNQPIFDISATVQFRVNKTEFFELPRFGNPVRAADLWLIEPPSPDVVIANGGRFNGDKMWDLISGSTLPILSADHLSFFDDPKGGRTYFMQLRFDEEWAEFDLQNLNRKVNELKLVNVLRIDVKCLPHDLEILDGSVKLVINDNVLKTFQIPNQKNNREDDNATDTYSNTTPFVILAYLTNSPPH